MDRSWLDDVDESLRELLTGSRGDFREGIASEIAQQWLQQVGYSKRRRLGKASVQIPLAGAVARSLFKTIASIAPDPETRARWLLILDRWLKQGAVNHELSGLLNPRSKTPLNLVRLERDLHLLGSLGAEEPVPQHLPKPRVVDFVKHFQHCVGSEPTLSQEIGEENLEIMVRRSIRSSTPPETAGTEVEVDQPDLSEYLNLEFSVPGAGAEPEPEPPPEKPEKAEESGGAGPPRPAPPPPAGGGEETVETSGGLFASHWVEDNQNQVHGMEAALQAGIDYWYGFRIGREARTGASTTHFAEPSALKEQEKTIVFLEVTSALLGPEKFERRRAVYTRGQGIPDQYFRLRAEAAADAVPLRIQIVHDNLPVYSESWTLQVAEGPVSTETPPRPAAAVAQPPAQSLGAVAGFGPVFRAAFRLKCDRQRLEILSPDMQSWPGRASRLLENPHDRMLAARKKMQKFADEKGLEKSFTKDTVRTFLREMAIWGRDCYDLIFDDSNETLRTKVVERLPVGSMLTIDTDSPSFPWEWLFLGEVPSSEEDFLRGDGRSEFLNGFWGIRFGISILPTISGNRIGLLPVLSNSERTQVLSSINPTAYPETAKANIELMEKLPTSYAQVKTEIARGREETIEMLRRSQTAQIAPHFVYFYCHHQAGNKVNEFGYLNDKESVFYLRGEEDDPLSVTDLKHDVKLGPFPIPQTPLVFLNACGSSQGQDFHPSGFVPYFTRDLLAASVIGTLAEIPAGQGLKMADDFLRLWFRGMPAATALQFLRRQWLEEKLNPFAMYYTLNGIAHLSLAQRLQS